MNASASLSIKIPARVQPSDMLIVTAAAAAKHQHPRKHPDAVWRKRLWYEMRKRAQAMRTPFRRLGVVRSVWLWARQEWRAKMERP